MPYVLDRIVNHDPRNRDYAIAEGTGLVTTVHERRIPVLDQGQVGSCTGNATVGVLGTLPVFGTEPAGTTLDEALALRIYSKAEQIDGGAGLPSEDNGSSGPSAAKAAKAFGLCSGYVHAFSLTAMQTALQTSPVMVGSDWLQSMFTPNADGSLTVDYASGLAGGHEYEVYGVDFERSLFLCWNSWGTSWGNAGAFTLTFSDMAGLLARSGDVTQLMPLTAPAPTPTPAPTPAPSGNTPADDALNAATVTWRHRGHVGSNASAARAVLTWAASKGYTP